MSALISRNDPRRLSAIRSLDLGDSDPDVLFDALAARLAGICEAPIAHVVLVEEHRHRFMGSVGIPGIRRAPMTCAFVAHLVATRKALTVPNASRDARFAAHPMVTGPANVQFFAGVPLHFSADVTLGSICVVDHVPRTLARHQVHALHHLAGIASRALVSRSIALHGIGPSRSLAVRDELRAIGIVLESDEPVPPPAAAALVVRPATSRTRRVLEPPFDLPDPNCLALDEPAICLLWADELSISVERLHEIVALVGPMRAAIRTYVLARRRAALRVETDPPDAD